MRRTLLCVALLACSPTENPSHAEAEPAAANPATAPKKNSETTAPKRSSEQSFADGMQLLCDSIDKVDQGLDPSERQRAVASWIDDNVKNANVRELFSIMGDVPPNKRAGMMNAAAAKAGITACAIADR